jgi:hypothetical protein
MNFKALATASLISAASFLVPTSAEARGSHCYETERGAEVCILSVHKDNTNRNVKWVKSYVNGSVSTDSVQCNPAHQNNYKRNMWGIACYEFN